MLFTGNESEKKHELARGRAPHCPGVEKSAPKLDELVTIERHWKLVEGNEKPLH